MREILFVLAHELDQFVVYHEVLRDGDTPRPRVRLRVVDGDPDLQVAEIAPREPLGDAQRLTVREPAVVEPGDVIQPDRFDDERVAFPLADRVAEPGRLRI